MTLRNQCTAIQLRAHAILDLARSGGDVALADVNWALVVLGEPI